MKEGITFGKTDNNPPEKPLTRAQKRQAKRAMIKEIRPPKYGPVVIYTESYKRVEGEKNVKFERGYTGRTNIKQLT